MHALITRRAFSALVGAAALPAAAQELERPRILIVVAHPDDEYAFAATVYRLTHELGAVVDQVVITDGAAGYRYSTLAQEFYGLDLTDQEVARRRLPAIRRQETLAAGRILGIRNHHFLEQTDGGFTLDPEESKTLWDLEKIRRALGDSLRRERYQFVFTLLPSADTHGHHQAVALLAVEAAQSLPENRRPVVLGAEPGAASQRPRAYPEAPAHGAPRAAGPVYEVSRTKQFGYRDSLTYAIVVNWVIAEHKSQGLFQTDVGKHDVERFWALGSANPAADRAVESLFHRLSEETPSAGRAVAGR